MREDKIAENETIKAARVALDEVNEAIRAYEKEKARLESEAQGTGVKALAAKNLLAQLLASPLMEKLSTALIKAEAAVRLAIKSAREEAIKAQAEGRATKATGGSMFWMNRELAEKKRLYGK